MTERTVRLLPLSGKSAGALRDLANRYLSWLDGEENSLSDATLADLAWTASVGRSHFPHRAGLVFSSAEQLRRELQALANTDEASDWEVPNEVARVGFVYTGHGSQWVGVGEALYRSEPVARSVLDRCDDLIRQERGASLLDVMFGRPGFGHDLRDPAWTEPVVYALECALTAQWASVGIRPSVVVGHGSGALAAAQAADVFSLDEGLRLAAALGDLARTSPERGVQATLDGLKAALAGVSLAAPSISLVDNVNGRVVESVEALDANYWVRQAEGPVDSSVFTETLARLGVGAVVEIGPNSIGDAWPASTKAPIALYTLRSPLGDGNSPESDEGFVRAVAGAYEAGMDILFTGMFAGENRRRISLPTYPFQRRRHWI